jgi:cytochrome c556
METKMKQTCKFCWGLSALLIVAVGAMGYFFMNPGNVENVDDGRTAIALSSAERSLVMSEMRGFLEGIGTITTAIGEQDLETVTQVARKLGMSAAGQVPFSLMGKLPSEFRTLGMVTHKDFDELAIEARDMGDQQVLLTRLGELINNCTTCHAAYRIDINQPNGD